MDTVPQLQGTLREALRHARLVLVDLHRMSFMDSTGLHVILDAAARARKQGARLVFAGATTQVEKLLDVTGTRAHLDLLDPPHPQDESSRVTQVDRNGSTPFDNPVNTRVITARVMAVSDVQLFCRPPTGPSTDRGRRRPVGSRCRPGPTSRSTSTRPAP